MSEVKGLGCLVVAVIAWGYERCHIESRDCWIDMIFLRFFLLYASPSLLDTPAWTSRLVRPKHACTTLSTPVQVNRTTVWQFCRKVTVPVAVTPLRRGRDGTRLVVAVRATGHDRLERREVYV